ncbi:MAG: acetoin utilization protein AcuC [Promethearchaeota archaeon]
MCRTALIKGPGFADYNFGEHHPLKPERVLLTWKLIELLELDRHPNCEIIEPVMVSDDDLSLYHDKEYIQFIKDLSKSIDDNNGSVSRELLLEGLKYNLGFGDNPVFPKIYQSSAYVVGGTVVAIESVVDDNGIDKAFNAAGGLHHARRGSASGFCIFNDIVIGILHTLKKFEKENLKVLYVDFDVHHCEGVQWAFDERADVLTVSFHESGKYLFPGTGFMEEIGKGDGEGFTVNIPLPQFTHDEVYLELFDEIVPPLFKAFQPDIVVSQNGVDTHCSDPLANLGLTTKGHYGVFRRIHELAKQYCNGKIVAVGGGGYNLSVVPRSWTMLFANLLGVDGDLPKEIPKDVLNVLNEGRTTDLVPPYFEDSKPCEGIISRLNDYKFLNEMELFVQEVKFHVERHILPKIEKKA